MYAPVFVMCACAGSSDPPAAPPPPTPEARSPFGGQLTARTAKRPTINRDKIAPLQIMHRRYEGRELYIDGEPRGPLPVTATLLGGSHTFEILVGPGDRVGFERQITPVLGFRVLDLGKEP